MILLYGYMFHFIPFSSFYSYEVAFFFFAFAFFLLLSLGFNSVIPALQTSAYRT